MRTDTEFIEAYLTKQLDGAENEAVAKRREQDHVFRRNLIAQAKVHLAALLYGRNLRRAQILSAAEKAFADAGFSHEIRSIFR